ncbi:MAG: hypothetical protein NZ521_10660, partial [Flammeovirgaceae bacterium]|nr:hypothetical protein [Flammeovirgaceae bacterium]MDW8288674.1 hypothetical protein [Flammeovirgaceae bacterium]
GELVIDNHYEFAISDGLIFSSDELVPLKEVRFCWNVNLEEYLKEDEEHREELIEKAGEMLKRDFIEFLKKAYLKK